MSDAVNPEYVAKIKKRQQEREASYVALEKTHHLTEKAISIVQLPVLVLVEKLRSRQLTATEVLHAYVAKALEVTERVNCITEFVPQAQEWAAQLDKKAADKNAVLGALHGLPLAVKDDQDVVGMDTTLGLAKKLEKPAKENAVIVKVLMAEGAVPFCKTNLPQSILSFGSDNPIYGKVKNGLRETLAPGGSSSGSGSIVGAGGAPIATGSDLGGSLRCPAHCHGLASLRGTTNRLSERGMVEGIPVITQRGVPGIIAPSAKVLAFLWKCLTEDNKQNKLDPLAVPIPWNETLFTSKTPLRIGYFQSLDYMPAFPDTQKTVLAARDALVGAGHKVVPFQMPNDFEYAEVIFDHCFGDQKDWLLKLFEGEVLAECMTHFVGSLRGKAQPEPRSDRERILQAGTKPAEGGSAERMKKIYKKREYTLDILGRMERAGVDLLLCPAFPHPAVDLDYGPQVMAAIVYTMFWNFVNFPTGVVRFGTETEGSVEAYEDKGDLVLKGVKEALKNSAGMPINVQVIGTPFKEELVLRTLVELERLAKI